MTCSEQGGSTAHPPQLNSLNLSLYHCDGKSFNEVEILKVNTSDVSYGIGNR
jgi:hypothetical protein